MKNLILILILLGTLFPFQALARDLTDESQAVVRLFVTRQRWDMGRPWSKGRPSASSCSGFFVKQGILTNGHCIADATFIEIEVPGIRTKLEADVVAVNHQVDLALVRLKEPPEDLKHPVIRLGHLPVHREKVVTIGYPAGGKQISFTEGIVSRIDVMSYAHSNMPSLMIQTDAAINPGNSGGPVFSDDSGRCLGVATQKNNAGEGLGYFVPVPVIAQFLQDTIDASVAGIPNLGIQLQTLENDAIRAWYSLPEDLSGVRIRAVANDSTAYGHLVTGDILTHIDGVAIHNDGQVDFRDGEQIGLGYLVLGKQVGETTRLSIWRSGKPLELSIPLKPFRFALVPRLPRYDSPPRFVLYGGIVFTAIEARHHWSWGGRYGRRVPLGVAALQDQPIGKDDLQELVVVQHIYSDTVNKGYEYARNRRVVAVDGKPVHALRDLAQALDKATGTYLNIELDGGMVIALDRSAVQVNTPDIAARYNLPVKNQLD